MCELPLQAFTVILSSKLFIHPTSSAIPVHPNGYSGSFEHEPDTRTVVRNNMALMNFIDASLTNVG